MDYLYHYTSVEVLALILKNRTIRFNSLDHMDDLQEQETADIKNAGQFCYISSWTDDEQESIPMWNMYSSLGSGVRIKMKKCPFKEYNNTAETLSSVVPVSGSGTLKSIMPLTDIFTLRFMCPQAMASQDSILHKVEYTQDQEKLYPSILKEGNGDFSINLGDLGKHKNIHWEFQKEWRYIFTVLPINLNQNVNTMLNSFTLVADKIKSGIEKQPFPYYDMVLSDEAYGNMEITLSPRISDSNREFVNLLKEKYNPSMEIKNSVLLGLL